MKNNPLLIFHDCDGACRYGKGWYELPQHLAKFSKGMLALDKIQSSIKKQIS